jgi:hypothetical protein
MEEEGIPPELLEDAEFVAEVDRQVIEELGLVTDDEELRRLTDEAHRAIGRYVVAFSQLIYQMRIIIVYGMTTDAKLGELALGQATAQQIADSFFGICRYRGNLDSVEANIANQLQTEVGQKVTERNKIAHGEWWVGGALGGARRTLELARLVRVYPNRREGDFEQVDQYSAADLDKISDRLIELRTFVSDFGRGALGMPMYLADQTMSAPGEYGISDVLVAKDVPKSGKGGTVVREGPRASELYAGPLFG